MAWTTPMTAVAHNALTAAQFNTHVRDNLNETEIHKFTDVGNFIGSLGTNSIREQKHSMRSIIDFEDTTSTSYIDLDTGGPTVSFDMGTTALVFFGAEMSNTGASNFVVASVGVSGASTVTESDNWCIAMEGYTAANTVRYTTCHRFTGLTAGVNTFTMKYKTAAGTATFGNRELMVIAL